MTTSKEHEKISEVANELNEILEQGEVFVGALDWAINNLKNTSRFRIFKRRRAKKTVKRMRKKVKLNAKKENKAQRKYKKLIRRRGPVSLDQTNLEATTRDWLCDASRLYGAHEVYETPELVDDKKGVYAWFFASGSLPVPKAPYHRLDGFDLLYVGIAGHDPKSTQTLRDRIYKFHLGCYAHNSTLRQSLGALLHKQLRLRMIIRGKDSVVWSDEDALTNWLCNNACVSWWPCEYPKSTEDKILTSLGDFLPLNIKENPLNPFAKELQQLRKKMREKAKK